MAPAEVAGSSIAVELVWSPQAGEVHQRQLLVAPGSSVEQALRTCVDFAPQLAQLAELRVGVWGRIKPLSTVLRENDRIEVYRPLTVDPKEARRQRYKARGQRIVSRHRPLAGKSSA
ncbi:MAG: RnfH family protein [Burkholderiaceae bacterium]|nr:RnfH family protein [Burkholderiaceae bacterium]